MRLILLAVLFASSPLFVSAAHTHIASKSRDADNATIGWMSTIRQTTSNSCGPAILASMANIRRGPATEFQMIATVNLQESGISLGEFRRVAELAGWPGDWYVGSLEHLHHIDFPVPVHFSQPENHFVLLHSLSSQYATFSDPVSGLTTIATKRFALRWTGYFYASRW